MNPHERPGLPPGALRAAVIIAALVIVIVIALAFVVGWL